MTQKHEISETLIIYAHPKTPGHNPKILEEIEKELTDRNKVYEVIDLYHIKYNPVLSEHEHYTSGEKFISKETEEFQKKILGAKNIIFIYPIWWGHMPAILKGFIDKTFTSGFSFKYVNGLPIGLLKGRKAAVIITSGAPKIVSKFLMGNRYQKSVKNDILQFCGLKTKVFQIDRATRLTEDQEKKIKNNVAKAIKWLY